MRRTAAALLAFGTALLLVLGVVAGWTSGTLLDTDTFVARVGPVGQDPTVRAAVAGELGDQLVTTLDLPAGPLPPSVRSVVRRAVTGFVDSPAFVKVWYAALRLAHEQVAAALTGSASNVQVVGGKVVVDLVPVMADVLTTLRGQLPAVLAATLPQGIPDNLPPAQIRARIARALGVDLPSDFGLLPVIDQTTLDSARQVVRLLNLSVPVLLACAVLAFVLALLASAGRRRTLLQAGLWTAVLTATGFLVAWVVDRQVVASVPDQTLRPAISNGIQELLSSLRGWGLLLFCSGLAVAVLAYLAEHLTPGTSRARS